MGDNASFMSRGHKCDDESIYCVHIYMMKTLFLVNVVYIMVDTSIKIRRHRKDAWSYDNVMYGVPRMR